MTNVGKWHLVRLDLQTGKVQWTDKSRPYTGWLSGAGEELLAYGHSEGEKDGRLRSLHLRSGAVQWSRGGILGLPDGFRIGQIFVGHLSDRTHAVDLESLIPLWSVPDLASAALSDGSRVIVPRKSLGKGDLTRVDLQTGQVRWHRTRESLGDTSTHIGCIWRQRFYGFYGSGLKAFDLGSGDTLWNWEVPGALHSWFPYDGRGYIFLTPGRYMVLDLVSGTLLFERDLGRKVPEPVREKKGGLSYGVRGQAGESWDARLIVSETHAFLANASGQIVVLRRDTGDIEQIVEIDGMPASEPIIYENRLLLTDFNAAVYCFEGAV